MLQVRTGTGKDFETVMDIYRTAQDFMIRTGNPNQWKHSHPTEEQIKEDIEKGICHVICEGEEIHGVFAICEGTDPTYLYVEGGEWLNDDPYITIHRIAGDQKVHGIFKCAVDYCRKYADNIRIDTHKDNKVMQNALKKNGFSRRGIIYLKNGDPRTAFQWCGERTVFRELTGDDDAIVARLVRSNLEKAGLDIPGTVYFDEALDHLSDIYGKDDSRYFVLEDKTGKVIGGIGFARFPHMENTAELQKLYLDDEAKGFGLGYKMVYFIEEQMRKAGFSRSYLETHDNLKTAIHVYENSGYRETDRPAEVVHGTMNRFFVKDL